jgi:REP element-mobilizing transposase RayT
MARLGRYFLPDQPLHVIQRGNNREATFFAEDDCVCYRDWLAAAAAEYGSAIHAYVLMTNHVHLLVTPGGPLYPVDSAGLGRTKVVREKSLSGYCFAFPDAPFARPAGQPQFHTGPIGVRV